ncbi:hypothetical protein B0I33_104487 [Prauserella shujinwangii]|uniref:Uncharacterized protein n=1 Tax=Prauserella shujinwangii TaxID=1453103 RepID=A0A2T0LXI4_9PSEU|nr:hypothetical protein [Prauserella shujinwangii]PRX48669.1 hypothetical protein B0I33_104487 [Prauserella shujinwangii]
MARRRDDLTELPERVYYDQGSECGRRGLYDWDQWLDGRIWELRLDEDFFVPIHQFTPHAHRAAARRGLRCSVRRLDYRRLLIQSREADEVMS